MKRDLVGIVKLSADDFLFRDQSLIDLEEAMMPRDSSFLFERAGRETALGAQPQNPATAKPAIPQATVVPPTAPPSEAAVRIASVSPKSVIAGASFTVAIQLPESFRQPITLTVHRFGLNITQYRRENLRDDDSLDGAPDEPGVIIHRVATSPDWTSAQALVSKGARSDKYLVMIRVR